MKNLRDRIKFNYLLRDDSNYKTFGYEIFENESHRDIAEVETSLKVKFIDSEYFYPEDFGIRKLSSSVFEIDKPWYEFVSLEKIPALEIANDNTKLRDIKELIGY